MYIGLIKIQKSTSLQKCGTLYDYVFDDVQMISLVHCLKLLSLHWFLNQLTTTLKIRTKPLGLFWNYARNNILGIHKRTSRPTGTEPTNFFILDTNFAAWNGYKVYTTYKTKIMLLINSIKTYLPKYDT